MWTNGGVGLTYGEGTAYVLRQSMIKAEDLRLQDAIINLNDAEFREGGKIDDFPNFARETMQRYKNSNLDLHKLVLCMTITDNDYGSESLATELILFALNYLSVKKLDIEFLGRRPFVLPSRVFESQSLLELTAGYCRIAKPISDNVGSLPLVALHLEGITIGDDASIGDDGRLRKKDYTIGNQVLRNILHKCPLLEYLYMFEIQGFSKINLSRMHNLKFCGMDMALDGSCFVEFFDQGPTQFPNMATLILFNDFKLESSFFDDFMFKFPSLKELSIHHCDGFEQVAILSPTLEFLTLEFFEEHENKALVLDVPNIRDVKYWGYRVPPLADCNTSKECESLIVLTCREDLPSQWFLSLREFLQKLGPNVSLGLNFEYCASKNSCIGKLMEEDISSGVPAIHLEKLVLGDLLGRYQDPPLSAASEILSSLFTFCRPHSITLVDPFSAKQRKPERDLPVLEFIFNLVREQVNWKCDLKQVTVETLFEENTLKEWRPILWDELISSLSLVNTAKIRLKLAWNGEQCVTTTTGTTPVCLRASM